MSLDDRFNPNDGSFIDRVDSVLLNQGKKIADFWQNKTYRDKAELETILYIVSSGGFIISSILDASVDRNYFASSYMACFSSLKAFHKSFRSRNGGISEEISCEAMGLPKKTTKISNMAWMVLECYPS